MEKADKRAETTEFYRSFSKDGPLSRILKQDSLAAAPRLLGWVLCRRLPEGMIKARIVETEAYHQDDPASHSFRGQTKRTAPMFMTGGHLYVYFTYGMHYALNIVTGPAGVGEGVLIRAAEPLEGLEIMRRNRSRVTGRTCRARDLMRGPGRLAQALGITNTSLSGKILDTSSIFLQRPEETIDPKNIVSGPRVGVRHNADAPWRFYVRGSEYVSKV